jgi:hypothetical protein
MLLTREVRFGLCAEDVAPPIPNSWGGWPAGDGLAPYCVLRAQVAGEVDARTGYLCNITFIDRAVRDRVIPAFQRRWRQSPPGKLICAGLVRESSRSAGRCIAGGRAARGGRVAGDPRS